MDREIFACGLKSKYQEVTQGQSRFGYEKGTRIDHGDNFIEIPSTASAKMWCETCGLEETEIYTEGNPPSGATNAIRQEFLKRLNACQYNNPKNFPLAIPQQSHIQPSAKSKPIGK